MLFATTVLCNNAQKSMENVWHIQSDTCISPSIPLVLLFIQVDISIYLEEIRVLPYINNERFSWRQSLTRGSILKTSKTEEKTPSELTCFVKLAAKQAVFPALPPYCQSSDFSAVAFTSHITICHPSAHRCVMITNKRGMGN